MLIFGDAAGGGWAGKERKLKGRNLRVGIYTGFYKGSIFWHAEGDLGFMER